LTEANIFGLWTDILNDELNYLHKKFDSADIQAVLSGNCKKLVRPDFITQEFKADEKKFAQLQMPAQTKINSKTDSPANQPQGAWYRGVLHFGVLLHDLVQV